MSEWIEIKRLQEDNVSPTSVRAYSIISVDKISDGSCRICLDDERHYYYTAAEPYEDVITRIKKAEEPQTIPVAERFTRDEYKSVLEAMERLINPSKSTQAIIDKLEDILKEEE